MADPHYHESHNKVELAFALAQLPENRVGVHWFTGRPQWVSRRKSANKLFGQCLQLAVEDVGVFGWYDVEHDHHKFEHCAACGRRAHR